MIATHTPAVPSGLLEAVRDGPDADTPRLVLADWWDDNGGETGALHARFVRGQVEDFRRLGGGTMVRSRWSSAGRHKAKLASMFGPMVYATGEPVPATHFVHNASGTGVVWHRGCIEAVSAPFAAWFDIGHAVLRQHPTIRRVHIHARSVVLPRAFPVTRLQPDGVAYTVMSRGLWTVVVPACRTLAGNADWTEERRLHARLFLEAVFPRVGFAVTECDPLRAYPGWKWPDSVGWPGWVVRRPPEEEP